MKDATLVGKGDAEQARTPNVPRVLVNPGLAKLSCSIEKFRKIYWEQKLDRGIIRVLISFPHGVVPSPT